MLILHCAKVYVGLEVPEHNSTNDAEAHPVSHPVSGLNTQRTLADNRYGRDAEFY